MLYIQHSASISPQSHLHEGFADEPQLSAHNKLTAREPAYGGIPSNLLRRMGRSTRMSIGAAMQCLKNAMRLDGVVIGTANGGMEDCIKFMEQIVKYHEEDLTPGNFVQSTPNGMAAQIALLKQNKGYNITHAHRGLSFEMALLDCLLLTKEHPDHCYLLGGVDEISSYNFNVDCLDGWIKKEELSSSSLYTSGTEGSIAGEGAAAFLAGGGRENAIAAVRAVSTIHTKDKLILVQHLVEFLEKTQASGPIDLLISGENGDARFNHFYQEIENKLNCPVARFKHLFGEYGTVSAQALHLAIRLLQHPVSPQHLYKNGTAPAIISNILIYNNYKETQHGFILVSRP